MKKTMPKDPNTLEVKIVTNDGQTTTRTYDKYDVQSWGDTLIRAEEIKADPGKMALLRTYLEGKEAALNSIADLRKLASKKIARDQQYQPEGSGSDDSDDDDSGEELVRYV